MYKKHEKKKWKGWLSHLLWPNGQGANHPQKALDFILFFLTIIDLMIGWNCHISIVR
jgi:hypothetical protein